MSRKERRFGPDEIVQARRRKGYGDVSSPQHGDIREGEIVPMRFEEADGREDFEVAGPWAEEGAQPPEEE